MGAQPPIEGARRRFDICHCRGMELAEWYFRVAIASLEFVYGRGRYLVVGGVPFAVVYHMRASRPLRVKWTA